MKHISEVVANLFLVREMAHREHLTTRSLSVHLATEKIYTAATDLADDFAECAIGIYGDIPAIQYIEPIRGKFDDALESIVDRLEDLRVKFSNSCDAPLVNQLDDISKTFNKALFLLRRLS